MFKFNFDQIEVWQPVYNDLSAWAPELWARESVAILEETMVYGGIVHRDFNDEVANFGDIVNTRQPAEFIANMYAQGDTVSYQSADATNIQVKLDCIADTSFKIYDVESSYSFADLVKNYLRPAVTSIARVVDRKIAGQAVNFLAKTTGGLETAISQDSLVETEQALNDLKVDEMGRRLVLSSKGKADILKTALFVKANEAGTSDALRRALMGDLFGMDAYMSLNTPSFTPAVTTTTAISAASGAAAGSMSIVTNAEVPAGQYCTIDGDMTPIRINTSGGAFTGVPTRAVREAYLAAAEVIICTPGLVNLAAGYVAGWTKGIVVDGLASGPHVGQIVAFGTHATHPAEYVIVSVTGTSPDYTIVLDRGLETALVNNAVVNYGPAGSLNPAFNRNAITLVNRPLRVANGLGNNGAGMAVASSQNISVRVATSWDQDQKALKVSVDSLFGVKTLDSNNGCVLLS